MQADRLTDMHADTPIGIFDKGVNWSQLHIPYVNFTLERYTYPEQILASNPPSALRIVTDRS